MLNYQETIDYIFAALPMFHRVGAVAYKADMGNILKLDQHLGNPHKKYKTIHIGGTNGKGSVSHNIASVLQQAGYKTGLFTSPHLVDFKERIRINGEMVSEEFVCEFVHKYKNLLEEIKPSFFEVTTAMAFSYFAEQNVDIAIIEVGMGGRLDSTNVISPILSVITNISLDHTQFLGETLEKIASEKAGIIKANTPIVIGEDHLQTRKIFTDKAREQKSQIYFADEQYSLDYFFVTLEGKISYDIKRYDTIEYPDLITDLAGTYQHKNILTTLQALEILQKTGIEFTKEHIYNGLAQTSKATGLRGRWQILCKKPLIICDTGHNMAAFQNIIPQIQHLRFTHLHIVIGFVEDKKIDEILKILPKNAKYYFTKANLPRALDQNKLAENASIYNLKGEAYENVETAISTAKSKAKQDDFIFIGGSTFVVAEAIPLF